MVPPAPVRLRFLTDPSQVTGRPGAQSIRRSRDSAARTRFGRTSVEKTGCIRKTMWCPAMRETAPAALSGRSKASNSASHENWKGGRVDAARKPSRSRCGSGPVPAFQAASSTASGAAGPIGERQGSSTVPLPVMAPPVPSRSATSPRRDDQLCVASSKTLRWNAPIARVGCETNSPGSTANGEPGSREGGTSPARAARDRPAPAPAPSAERIRGRTVALAKATTLSASVRSMRS